MPSISMKIKGVNGVGIGSSLPKDRSESWKEGALELINRHPLSKKMLSLLENRVVVEKDKPFPYKHPANCFGTAHFLLDEYNPDAPAFMQSDDLLELMDQNGYSEISRENLPDTPEYPIVQITKDGSTPTHAALYLGRTSPGSTPLVFEKAGIYGSIQPNECYVEDDRYIKTSFYQKSS